MRDGALVHRSDHTKLWLKNLEIPVLDWPTKYPDIWIIENVGLMMERVVYTDEKQYKNCGGLRS